MVEHNLDVVAHADWVIEMGPGGGQRGGTVMFEGTPHDLSLDRRSLTGRALRRALETAPRVRPLALVS